MGMWQRLKINFAITLNLAVLFEVKHTFVSLCVKSIDMERRTASPEYWDIFLFFIFFLN
jgi:hypothetical protein